MCRRLGRCIKKRTIGDPKLSEISFLGINLGKLRDKLLNERPKRNLNETKILSQKTLAENKIKLAKANTDDIEQIRDLRIIDLKKKHEMSGYQLKVLGEMVQNYKQGNVSLTKVPLLLRPFQKKQKLTKERLHEIIENYATAKEKRDAELIRIIKSRRQQNLLNDLEIGSKFSAAYMFKSKLNLLKNINLDDINLQQYIDAINKQGIGRSSRILKYIGSFHPSKFKELLEQLKDMRLSEVQNLATRRS